MSDSVIKSKARDREIGDVLCCGSCWIPLDLVSLIVGYDCVPIQRFVVAGRCFKNVRLPFKKVRLPFKKRDSKCAYNFSGIPFAQEGSSHWRFRIAVWPGFQHMCIGVESLDLTRQCLMEAQVETFTDVTETSDETKTVVTPIWLGSTFDSPGNAWGTVQEPGSPISVSGYSVTIYCRVTVIKNKLWQFRIAVEDGSKVHELLLADGTGSVDELIPYVSLSPSRTEVNLDIAGSDEEWE